MGTAPPDADAVRSYHRVLVSAVKAGSLPRPNLFGIGPGRSGSTTLWYLLRTFEDVFVCPVKETNYFGIFDVPPMDLPRRLSRRRQSEATRLDEQDYRRLFLGGGSARYVAEVTPVYIALDESLQAIKAFAPDAFVVVTLRDPLARFLSQYRHHAGQAGHAEVDKLAAYVEAAMSRHESQPPLRRGVDWFDPVTNLRTSLYASRLAKVHELFGDRVLLLLHDDLRDGTETWTSQLAAFLDLPVPAAPSQTGLARYRNASPAPSCDLEGEVPRALATLLANDLDACASYLPAPVLERWRASLDGI